MTDDRRRLGAPALRTFLAIAGLWRLTGEQQRLILGSPSRSAYSRWRKRVREQREITLEENVLMRISAVLGIHQGLGDLFADELEGAAWLHKPHRATLFGGNPPINLIADGTLDGPMTVRRFVDAARSGLYMPPTPDEANVTPYDDSEIIFE
jgi:hypothetical protein